MNIIKLYLCQFQVGAETTDAIFIKLASVLKTFRNDLHFVLSGAVLTLSIQFTISILNFFILVKTNLDFIMTYRRDRATLTNRITI